MDIKLIDLDFQYLSAIPIFAKIGIIVLLSGLLLFVGYWTDTRKQLSYLEEKRQEEFGLRATFEKKQLKAAHLQTIRDQIATINASFGAFIHTLANNTQVPGLLEDISNQGLASGVEFRTIRVLPEKEMDFYVELPMEIFVVGDYHQLSAFVGNIAAMERIVTLHDFVIRPLTQTSADNLMMTIVAKTYHDTKGEKENDKIK